MKATLEFNLPEEREDMQDALDVWKFRAAMSEFSGWLRSKEKYCDDPATTYGEIRDEWIKILNENGVEV